MPVEEIANCLNADAKDERKKLYLQLALHCAPFLKGMKESALLTLPREQALPLVALAAEAKIDWYFLHHEGGKSMVFLYRREGMERHLDRTEVSAFLVKAGYGEQFRKRFRIFSVLAELSERVGHYYRSKEAFPHEIGVLLGYPAADVEAYIANEGKNCLLVGYWKVYHREQEARRIFAAFDEARERMVREVLEGKELTQLCAS